MQGPTEIELKFQVPVKQRAQVAAEMARGPAEAHARQTLVAAYLDSADRRLAAAGIAWRLRREGRRWVQSLKKGGANPLERFEHEVLRPGPTPDAAAHAGTPVGEELLAILAQAAADEVAVDVRFRTEVRRTIRRLRVRGATVELAFDEGRILAGERVARVRELEFELVAGDAGAMIALASRWCGRLGLAWDPRSKAERGDALADGKALAPVRKGRRAEYRVDATATEALAAVLDECLAQIGSNAIGLLDGDEGNRVDHVHQMRVGIRRLRSALRCFAGWTPAPPRELVDGLRALFATLGESRDSDVLETGVAAELAAAGAPRLTTPPPAPGPDLARLLRTPAVQQLLLAWIAWRTQIGALPPEDWFDEGDRGDRGDEGEGGEQGERAEGEADVAPREPADLRHDAERRLRRWHRRIAADWKRFDELDEAALHSLRKRIKRQRYAVEFFSPVLRRRSVSNYLGKLESIQDRMGQLNDLFVARAHYRERLAEDPAAWFALGWLAARIDAMLLVARPELGRLAKVEAPVARVGQRRSRAVAAAVPASGAPAASVEAANPRRRKTLPRSRARKQTSARR